MSTSFKLRYPVPTKHYVPKVTKHEQNLQLQVCRYLDLRFPNAIYRSDFASGLRLSPFQAKLHKSMQSGRAWLDLFIYEPRQGFSGLGIDLKKAGTKIIVERGPRKGHIVADEHVREQVLMCKELRRRGYYATITCGFDETIEVINWYFDVEKPKEQETIF